jgi:hypothetical protein
MYRPLCNENSKRNETLSDFYSKLKISEPLAKVPPYFHKPLSKHKKQHLQASIALIVTIHFYQFTLIRFN